MSDGSDEELPDPDPAVIENWQLVDNVIRGLVDANAVQKGEPILHRVLLHCVQVEKASFSQAELVEALRVKNMLLDRDGEVHLIDY